MGANLRQSTSTPTSVEPCRPSCATQLRLISAALDWQQFATVPDLVNGVLSYLDPVHILDDEISPLGRTLLGLLDAMPRVVAAAIALSEDSYETGRRRNVLMRFGFATSGLLALAVGKAIGQPDLYHRLRPFLLQSTRQLSEAWSLWSPLACQELDRNRFALRIAGLLAEREVSLRPALTRLVASCVLGSAPNIAIEAFSSCAPAAALAAAETTSFASSSPSFWNTRFYDVHLEGVVVALKYAKVEDAAQCGPAYLLFRFLVFSCHQELALTEGLLDRVLLFLDAWEREIGASKHCSQPSGVLANVLPRKTSSCQHSVSWLEALTDLGLNAEEHEPHPIDCIVAFFLQTGDAACCSRGAAALETLATWVRAIFVTASGIYAQKVSGGTTDRRAFDRTKVIIRGFCACRLTNGDAFVLRDIGDWISVAVALKMLLEQVLLPVSLLDQDARNLGRHRLSSVCRSLPNVAEAFAKCLSRMTAMDQARLVLEPIDEICYQWSEAWVRLPTHLKLQPSHQWFARALFLFVSTVFRQADHVALSSEVTFLGLRALSHLDLFRDDSQEFRALCLSLVEHGADSGELFITRFFQLATECHGRLRTDSTEQFELLAASRLHFLLGALASPKLINVQFFEVLWPIIISCVLVGSLADVGAPRWQLALRAQSLASASIGEELSKVGGGSLGHERVLEYFQTCIRSFGGGSGTASEEALTVLLPSVVAASRSIASRVACPDSLHDSVSARELQRWLLRLLGDAVLERLQAAHLKVAESLFTALCTAAAHVHEGLLPEPFYTESRLLTILAVQGCFREAWARSLVTAFAEGPKEILITRLLADFPGATAGILAEMQREVDESVGPSSLSSRLLRSFL